MSQTYEYDFYQSNNLRKIYFAKGSTFDQSSDKLLILAHDGQNMFEDQHASYQKAWQIESVLAKLGITNYLVVGIASLEGLSRIREYSPVENRADLKNDPKFQAMFLTPIGGVKYLDQIKNHFIKHLEQKFNFNFKSIKKIMLGSSMGGVITTYAAKVNPTWFDAYLAFSNALYANYPYMYDFITKDTQIGRYYHDMGGKETSGTVATEIHYQDAFQWMNDYLLQAKAKFYAVFDSEAKHDERAWHQRLANAIRWAIAG